MLRPSIPPQHNACMQTPSASALESILKPHLTVEPPASLYLQLAAYLEVLYAWNARISLTAIQNPQEMVRLHLVECLLAAQLLPPGPSNVLDYGSGTGLPGIPAAALRHDLHLTLAESQQKKAVFLREVIRRADLPNASVWAGRVEDLPKGHRFDAVMLRAVDRMDDALTETAQRVKTGGCCLVLTSESRKEAVRRQLPGFAWQWRGVPESRQRVILQGIAS